MSSKKLYEIAAHGFHNFEAHKLYFTFLSSLFSMYYSHTLSFWDEINGLRIFFPKINCFGKYKRRSRSLIGSDRKYHEEEI